MVEEWIAEIKRNADYSDLGMILVHNGMVVNQRAWDSNGSGAYW